MFFPNAMIQTLLIFVFRFGGAGGVGGLANETGSSPLDILGRSSFSVDESDDSDASSVIFV